MLLKSSCKNLERLRRQSGKELLIAHLNINSIQNKFEELRNVIKVIRVHIKFVSETKIDSCSVLITRLLFISQRQEEGLRRNFGFNIHSTLEDPTQTRKRLFGVYRPPRALCGEYQLQLEKELSEICNWASSKSNHVVVIGDLNLDGWISVPSGEVKVSHPLNTTETGDKRLLHGSLGS